MEITSSLAAARPGPLAGLERAASPDAAATAQFAALMQAPAPESVQAAAVSGTSGLEAVAPGTAVPGTGNPSSIGDRILLGMQGISSEFRENWRRVTETLSGDGPELRMQEMLSLQLQINEASVQLDLVGKLASRATQNFDQLVRVQ